MDILVSVERIANVPVVGRAEANQSVAVVSLSSGRSKGADDMFESLAIVVDFPRKNIVKKSHWDAVFRP